MWESFIKPGLIGAILNWIGVLVVFLIDGRISEVLTPLAIFWTVLTIVAYRKVKQEET
jgi:hypothetical protein